jgi:hypothetical protein
MSMEDKPVQDGDRLMNARERVSIGPVPAWVAPRDYDPAFKPKETRHFSHLLFSRQDHAECRQAHYHTAIRLETMESVQRNSQWSLQFQPKFQSITLHWIIIRREGAEVNQASLEKIRLLEREEGLERLIILGDFTLLLVLEDVRPGDVIDSCYTIETHPPLLAGHYATFCSPPAGPALGAWCYSLRFGAARPMKWKSSASELAPVESLESPDGGEKVWVWSGEKVEEKPPEPNMPAWHLAYPWIQVSDCPDWGTVAAAVAGAYAANADESVFTELAGEITAGETELLARVDKAIQWVQDGFRYLSVNVEFGGQIPQPPGVVLRKRYGDCKDLAFLLVHLLKHLGVAARPILVNTDMRKTLGDVLPIYWFNHAVVEFTVPGETRWVDPVIKNQGGGALKRYIPPYGLGLPVDPAATRLIAPPALAANDQGYELRETILLDTSGAASHLSVLVRAQGFYADSLRRQLAAQGAAELARERLKLYVTRFNKAERVGSLEYRDDRAANEFLLAEVFEINGFLTRGARPGLSRFVFPANLVAGTLAMPDKKARQAPFALPYPCNLVQILEIQTDTQKQGKMDRLPVGDEFVTFNRTMEMRRGWLRLTLNLSTLTDAVPPKKLEDYRAKLAQILQTSAWNYTCPAGHSHPRRRSDFGALPPPPRPAAPGVPLPETPLSPAVGANPPAGNENPAPDRSSRRRHRNRSRGPMKPEIKLLWFLLAVAVAFMVVVFLAWLARPRIP